MASIDRAEKSLQEDAGLHDMCKLAYIDLTRLVADEKKRALTRLEAINMI